MKRHSTVAETLQCRCSFFFGGGGHGQDIKVYAGFFELAVQDRLMFPSKENSHSMPNDKKERKKQTCTAGPKRKFLV